MRLCVCVCVRVCVYHRMYSLMCITEYVHLLTTWGEREM